MPSRPSCSALIASQRSRTRPAVRASASPNTCGWRRTASRARARATSSRSPSPCSSSRSARKNTWKSRSPSSSRSFADRPGERGVGDLVGLLDRVRDDRASRLLAIPGALAPQAPSAPGARRAAPSCAHAADVTRRSSSSAGRRWTCPAARTRRRTGPCPCTPSRRPATHLLIAVFFFSDSSCVRIWSLTWANGVDRAGLDVRERLDQVVAELRLTGCDSSFVFERERGLVERGDGLALRDRRACRPRPSSRGRSSTAWRAPRSRRRCRLELRVELVGASPWS